MPARNARSRPGPKRASSEASKARHLVEHTLDQLQLPGVSGSINTGAVGIETGVIYCDDNARRLPMFPAESVDLIYLDPPFFSNRQYEVIWGDEAEVRSFEDRWAGGIQVYVSWMRERLLEMRRVLKRTGSIYLHCDPHASHYLKLAMDEVFGQANFRSEIVWKRTSAHSSARRYGPVHDVLLFYTLSDDFVWNPLFQKYDDSYLDAFYTHKDLTRRWRRSDLTGAGVRYGETGKPWRGIEVTPKGRHWFVPPSELDKLDAAGKIHWPKKEGGVPMLKRYADEQPGVSLQDVWTDIPPMHNLSRERVGFPTQKPEALLDRIIRTSSNQSDVVLDPFCGCGTTLVVANRDNRRWIGIDISPTACNLMRRRLIKDGAPDVKLVGMPTTEQQLLGLRPFEFQNWIIDRINGAQAPKRTGDMGIDGLTFLLKEPIQIKQSENIGREVLDKFETAITRAHHTRGFIIALSFTKGSREEVARVRKDGLDIHLLTVRDLLERPDWVLVQMGIASGLPQLSVAPMPQIDPGRRSAEELIVSDAQGG